MKSFKIFVATALVSLTASATAYADNTSSYIGGNISALDYSETGFQDATVTALYGRFGAFFNENISGEVRLGIGVGDDDVSVPGFGTVNLDLEHFAGLYLRAGLPVSEAFYPYLLLGYTRSELKATTMGVSVTDSESDVSFGLGLDFNISDSVSLNAEYSNLLDKGGVEIDAISLGFAKSF